MGWECGSALFIVIGCCGVVLVEWMLCVVLQAVMFAVLFEAVLPCLSVSALPLPLPACGIFIFFLSVVPFFCVLSQSTYTHWYFWNPLTLVITSRFCFVSFLTIMLI